MALKLCTKSVDGTIPVPALLYDDEQLISSQDGVGIYQGDHKSPPHQSGSAHITTHRLFYIDNLDPSSRSFALDLGHVQRTDFYAGLFTSSAKITLFLSRPQESSSNNDSGPSASDLPDLAAFETWECQVCAYKNPPGLSPAAAKICGLCGVPREASSSLPSTPKNPSLLSAKMSAASSSPSLPQSAPSSSRRASSIACPACTFLNHPSLRTCEICETELPRPFVSLNPVSLAKSAPVSRPDSPHAEDDEDESFKVIKVSFRKGGEKLFYTSLKRSLQRKAWEGLGLDRRKSTPNLGEANVAQEGGRMGISGILQNVQNNAQGRETSMRDALQDLEALRIKAQDMVHLAAELNEKLTASSATSSSPSVAEDMNARDPHGKVSNSAEPEEATFIRSSLSQLGLQMADAPVTMDMIRNEKKWIEELAKELAGVLQGSPQTQRDVERNGGMMKSRGIIALDEVWGGWNRARGVALIPPSTFLQVLELLPLHTSPAIKSRKFSSGLTVLHTPPFSNTAFTARLCSFLVLAGPQTTMEIAQEEGLTVGMASMMLDSAELAGDLVRDDVSMCSIVSEGGGGGSGNVGLGEVEWYPNLFTGYLWDGEPAL